MKRRFITFILTCLTLSLAVAGCASAGTTSVSTTATTARPTSPAPTTTGAPALTVGQDLMSGIRSVAWTGQPKQLDPVMIQAIRRFAAALLQESMQNEGNVLVSPASVFLALSMTANGADGETLAAMIKTLADQGITIDQINEASHQWIRGLMTTGGRTTLSIANSIWFRDSFDPDPLFLQTNADAYNAGARRLDFADEQATGIINGWVEDQTRGLIKKIIEKINPTTVMFLINTVYFKSDWLTPFEPAESRKRPFKTPGGPVDVDFMHQTGPMRYFTGQMTAGDEVRGIALPYENGQFAYFAVQSKTGQTPRDWLARQDEATLFADISAFMAQKANFTVSLALPKYKAEFEDSLLNELDTLGMGIAFDGGRADFSRLSVSRSKGLYISEVKHKTFISVDEKGTEAAAATSVAIDESMPAYDVEVVFDQPFLYGIMDLKTGIPLFVGILESPQAQG